MPGILFMLWITGAVVLSNAEVENYESLDAFKASVEKVIEESKPEYKVND